MTLPASAAVDSLAAVERRFSRRGLLIRYAKGRVQHFFSRQIVTLLGAAVLLFANGLASGLAAIGLALLGEAVDCLYLSRVSKQLKDGRPFQSLYIGSSVTAFFQAVTISGCVALGWFGETSHASTLFPVAFLAGAAINAGLAMPFHKAAALVRLSVYATMLLFLFGSDWLWHDHQEKAMVIDFLGALIMAYLVYMFLLFVQQRFRQSQASTMAITAKGRELAQREREARQLSLVARNANDSVILSDAEGRITWVNGAFTQITGYSFEDVIGRRPGDFLNGPNTDPAVIDMITDSIQNGEPFRGEIENLTKDGRRIWIETNLVPVHDAKGNVDMSVAIERDVTEARQHAQEMALARRAAEDGARAKTEFLATMSHEIRTPMNGVIGMADMLEETDLTMEQQDYVGTIRSSAEALVKIINDILDMSKLDAKKLELSLAPFDLSACLRDITALLTREAELKGLSLTLQGLDALPQQVVGDEGRLRQILINLVGNAIKFTETGGVSLAVQARPMPQQEWCVSVRVEDTGVGIPEHRLEAIFNSFEQADAATTRRFGGTGLGLSISRMLVEAMGGKIEVKSTSGEGSCFEFSVRMGGADEQTSKPRFNPGPEALEPLRGLRVLLAEDNPVNRKLIDKYLSKTPVELAFAHDGQEAIELTRDWCPDLVFMDMSMPVVSGLEATEQIRASHGPQPVIVALTANAFDSDRRACEDAGMEGFLSKPIRKNDLLASLLQFCPAAQEARTG